jgi:hypothetical protein
MLLGRPLSVASVLTGGKHRTAGHFLGENKMTDKSKNKNLAGLANLVSGGESPVLPTKGLGLPKPLELSMQENPEYWMVLQRKYPDSYSADMETWFRKGLELIKEPNARRNIAKMIAVIVKAKSDLMAVLPESDIPSTFGDWEVLARYAGFDAKFVHGGKWRFQDITRAVIAKVKAEGIRPKLDSPDAVKPIGEDEPEAATTATPRITKNEANFKARKIIGSNPDITAIDLASQIGCSRSLVYTLGAWQSVAERTRKDKPPPSPKAVSFTKPIGAIAEDPSAVDPSEEAAKNEEIERLIRDQIKCRNETESKKFTQRRKL